MKHFSFEDNVIGFLVQIANALDYSRRRMLLEDLKRCVIESVDDGGLVIRFLIAGKHQSSDSIKQYKAFLGTKDIDGADIHIFAYYGPDMHLAEAKIIRWDGEHIRNPDPCLLNVIVDD